MWLTKNSQVSFKVCHENFRRATVPSSYWESPPWLLYHISNQLHFDSFLRYSRKILWLEVARTNNDPEIIAGYFLDLANEVEGKW